LEENIEKRLLYFGIRGDGSSLEPAKLSHLTSEDLEVRRRLDEAIEKEMGGRLSRKEAVARYVRHVGFTFLNRLAAIRAMEVRGFIKETIIRKDKYKGRSLRERDIVEANPSLTLDEALKKNLVEAFQEVGEQIKVLFDIDDEYSLVFPETRTCLELIRLLSEGVTEDDWQQDDVIGWIYQYFNSEARKEFRKAKRKPRADDIPVINQFYTPDWIVKALVDNTLGRLWLEMHPDSKIREFCIYFVPLKEQPSAREIKRVRDIKILDPACGSGHFLVYAFDLLYRMYLEDEPETPPLEVPTLILENNLFGIDIDLRAVQLAALSLYFKAKKYSPSLRVRGMNLVCADVRIADSGQRLVFLRRFQDDPALQRIFSHLFEELNYTYEIGSLLKVRVPFERLFDERVSGGGAQARLSLPITGQAKFGDKGLAGQTKFAFDTSKESSEALLTLAIPKERTIEEMLDGLRSFEHEAIEAQDMGRLLFATEAEKSVGLLSILSQKYDVVLMNPPYGRDMPTRTKEYLRRCYPKTHHDYYAAFMEQAIDIAYPEGYVGALVSRTFLFLTWYKWIRENLLKSYARPQLIWDLGFGVLDEARHNWAAFSARKMGSTDEEQVAQQQIAFFRLIEKPDERQKIAAWEEAISTIKQEKEHPLFYRVTLEELSKIPGTPYSYWTSKALRKLFHQYPPLDRDVARRPNQPKIADVKQGLATADDYRFTRFWWEVPVEQIAATRKETFQGKKWVPFANEVLLFYYFADLQTLINWRNDGEDIRNFPKAVIRSDSFYFQPGLTWSVSINKSQLKKIKQIQRIPFRILPRCSIFGVAAQGVIVDAERIWALLAICCSKLIYYLSRLIVPEKMPGTGYTASLPIVLPSISSKKRTKELGLFANEAYHLLKEWATGEEISTLFIKPWILQVLHGFDLSWRPITQHPLGWQFEWSDWSSAKAIRSIHGSPDMALHELAELCLEQQQMLEERVDNIQKEIDEEVYRTYGISDEDRALIEHELALRRGEQSKGEEVSKEEKSRADVVSVDEHIKRLISYYVKRAIESDGDGIVPLNEMFPDNLVKKLREFVATDFGVDQVERFESEMHQILGKSLQDWLAQDYFGFHISLYRWRPIFWQLASYRHGRSHNPPGVFSCFVHYHKDKLTRDTIPKILAHYIPKIKERLTREKEWTFKRLEEARASNDRQRINKLTKEYDTARDQLTELQRFEEALNMVHNPRKDPLKLQENARWVDRALKEVRDNGWNPIIDYGVRVNIESLKEAKLLPSAADRVK